MQEAINDLKSYAENSWGSLNKTFELAISALEKQILKKPIKDTNYSHGRYTVAKCPTCDGLLGLYSFAEKSFKCCCECGQALDWGDSE